MKTFLAIYTGTAAAREPWNALDPEERAKREQAGMKAWGDWMTTNADVVVETGGPLGKTKRVSRDGITDVSNAMAGYVVIRAESHQAAAKLFEDHPHFSIFPGDGVEIMEVLPIPGT